MKRNLFISFLVVSMRFLVFCEISFANAKKMSELFSGRVEYSASVDSYDRATCIRPAEGLSGSASLTFVAKRDFFVFPQGTYFGTRYSTDFAGSGDPLAKVLSLSAGWMNDSNSVFHVVLGIDLLNIHNYGEDALRFHFETRERLWNDPEGIHQLTAVVEAATTIGNNDLNGFNANLGIEHELKAIDASVALVQYAGAGLDDGSYGRPATGMLFYEIYGKFCILNAEIKIPYISAEYCDEGSRWEDSPSSRGQKKFGSIGAEFAYNFW